MRWLIFDAVHTLIAPREPVAVTYHKAGVKHGSQLSLECVDARFQFAFRLSEELSYLSDGEPQPGLTTSEDGERRRWRGVVEKIFREEAPRGTYDDPVLLPYRLDQPGRSRFWMPPQIADVAMEPLFAELWQHYADPAAWIVLPDVAETLQTLRQRGFRLGVASNFDGRLDAVLAGLKRLPAFDAVFVSSRVGYRKPAPAFYQHVIAACGVRPDEITMIGDNVVHDYTAPRAAGMSARLLDATGLSTLLE